MRYRLRTLLIVLAIGPMVLAPIISRAWTAYLGYMASRREPEYLGNLVITGAVSNTGPVTIGTEIPFIETRTKPASRPATTSPPIPK